MPDSVLISGPETSVGNINEWPTKLIELDQLDKDQKIPLPLEEPLSKSITIEPPVTQLEVQVEQLTEKNFFVPVIVKNGSDSIKIFPENIKISCIVGLSLYDQIGPEDFVLEVDMSGISPKEENNTLPVLMSQQPEEVKGVHLSYQSVEFFFVENKTNEE